MRTIIPTLRDMTKNYFLAINRHMHIHTYTYNMPIGPLSASIHPPPHSGNLQEITLYGNIWDNRILQYASMRSRDSSVGTAIRLCVGRQTNRYSIARKSKKYLFSAASRPSGGSIQPPVQWVPGAFSPGIKRQRRESDHSILSSAEVKNGGAIPPLSHTS
jgi:hypothetical protein